MKRRNFIRDLCKTVAVASIVPVALVSTSKSFTLPFNEKYYIGVDLIDPTYNTIVFKARGVGRSQALARYFVEQVYTNPCRLIFKN